jgi:hypothetical protein
VHISLSIFLYSSVRPHRALMAGSNDFYDNVTPGRKKKYFIYHLIDFRFHCVFYDIGEAKW